MNNYGKDSSTYYDNNVQEKEKWQEFVNDYKDKGYIIQSEFGIIDMAKDAMKDIHNGENLSYEEYLEVLFNSRNNRREYFEYFYYNNACCSFKGRVSRFDKKRGKVIFDRIYVVGILMDGQGCIGTEDHVWMDMEPFEQFKEGDCVSFRAEIYRYLKRKKGKLISFGLRKPYEIDKIDDYELPGNEELVMQSIEHIICEVCMYNEQCYMGICIASEQWREDMKKTLLDAYKAMERKQ